MQMLCTRLIKAAPLPSTRCCRWKIKLCLKSIERRRREREREREREMEESKNGNRQTSLRWNEPRACISPGKRRAGRAKRFANVDWMESMAQAGCRTPFLIMRSQKEDWLGGDRGFSAFLRAGKTSQFPANTLTLWTTRRVAELAFLRIYLFYRFPHEDYSFFLRDICRDWKSDRLLWKHSDEIKFLIAIKTPIKWIVKISLLITLGEFQQFKCDNVKYHFYNKITFL